MRDFLGWQGLDEDLERPPTERVSPGKVSLTGRIASREAPAEAAPHPLAMPMGKAVQMRAMGGRTDDPFALHQSVSAAEPIGIGQQGGRHGARRGGGHTGEAPASPDQITVRNASVSPGGEGRARTTVGVGEHMTFTAPGRASGAWTATGGSLGAATGPTLQWIAPVTPGPVTINFAGTPNASLPMNVIAPTGVEFSTLYDLAGNYAAGTAGAGMGLRIGVLPWSVSFGGIYVRELGDGAHGVAHGVEGYFSRFSAADLRHAPTAAWADITDSNFTDTARDQGDTAASRPGRYPAPWRAGSYHWNIPYHYRVQSTSGDGFLFTTVTQTFRIADDGTVTITKGNESVSRSPGGAPAQPAQAPAQPGQPAQAPAQPAQAPAPPAPPAPPPTH